MKKFTIILALLSANFLFAGSLANGVPATDLSGSRGQTLYFQIDVPVGTSHLTIETYGGNGNAELYASIGQTPSPSIADYRSENRHSDELIEQALPKPGTYYIALYGARSFRKVNLIAEFEYNVEASFDFESGMQGWSTGFSDYSILIDPSTMNLYAGHEKLPASLGQGYGVYVKGSNRSDDLFMFLKRKLGTEYGISPNTTYEVHFDVAMASNAGTQCIGIGGAPGESVYFKAGATSYEPKSLLMEMRYEMNIDKGNQSQEGTDMTIMGNVASSASCTGTEFGMLQHTGSHTFTVTSNERGEVWIIVGTDSGYEGTTELYYDAIDVTLIPIKE